MKSSPADSHVSKTESVAIFRVLLMFIFLHSRRRRSRDGIVVTVTTLRVVQSTIRTPAEARDFSLLQIRQAGRGDTKQVLGFSSRG